MNDKQHGNETPFLEFSSSFPFFSSFQTGCTGSDDIHEEAEPSSDWLSFTIAIER